MQFWPVQRQACHSYVETPNCAVLDNFYSFCISIYTFFYIHETVPVHFFQMKCQEVHVTVINRNSQYIIDKLCKLP